MQVPIEYNVTGGLIGLGPDILLEVLSTMRLIPDAIQFIGINKKMMQLKNHSRFIRIIETLNYPIAIHNPDPIDVDFTDIDEVQKMIMICYPRISLSHLFIEIPLWLQYGRCTNRHPTYGMAYLKQQRIQIRKQQLYKSNKNYIRVPVKIVRQNEVRQEEIKK
ncbi:MAG: hypothetical protein EZS28_013766 [Streblomastix strix]|uniref:Uncharacterized protein n=1 Tax=Streblomastix strix TaxID=222440 RepID=A0A5J4W7M3_9EUKA|nr:MAG: hypothetical protein EZS28_013766 [Streblomastix strix]